MLLSLHGWPVYLAVDVLETERRGKEVRRRPFDLDARSNPPNISGGRMPVIWDAVVVFGELVWGY
jgi:hypothetical protein